MSLETESLRRELRAEIADLRDRLDVAMNVLSAHKTSIDRLDASIVSLQDATAMLTRRMDAPVASALDALVAGLRAENERLRRLVDYGGRDVRTAETIAQWVDTLAVKASVNDTEQVQSVYGIFARELVADIRVGKWKL